jgi:hypothetical protein
MPVPATAMPTPPTIVVNGGFEIAITNDWGPLGDTTNIAIDSSNSHSGAKYPWNGVYQNMMNDL